MISGQLVIGASHNSPFSLPNEGDFKSVGNHSGSGRYTGAWEIVAQGSWSTHNLLLPHRDKRTAVYTLGGDSLTTQELVDRLAVLDANYEGQSQLQKYHSLLGALPPDCLPFASVLNTESTHSSFALLSHGLEISLVGVYDLVMRSATLLWAMHDQGPKLDLVQLMRQAYPLKYLMYRFPPILDRAIFIPTQATCAHWWKYMQNQNDPLFAFNALELKLFKNQVL